MKFGQKVEDKYFYPLYKKSEHYPVPPLTAKRMLLEEYETAYGIFDHDHGEDDPLNSILMRTYEDVSIGSDRTTMAYRYANCKVWDVFKIPFHEYLNLPKADADELLEIAYKVNVERAKHRDALAEELESLAQK